jgi:hypothetical protein
MASAYTGHNARHWHSTQEQRTDAIRPAPSTCDKLRSYLQSPEDWARDFLWAVFNDWYWRGCPEEPMPDVMRDCLFTRQQHGVHFTVDFPQAPQDATKTRVFIWDAQKSEEAWTKARKAGEANRGNVMVMPWKVAA